MQVFRRIREKKKPKSRNLIEPKTKLSHLKHHACGYPRSNSHIQHNNTRVYSWTKPTFWFTLSITNLTAAVVIYEVHYNRSEHGHRRDAGDVEARDGRRRSTCALHGGGKEKVVSLGSILAVVRHCGSYFFAFLGPFLIREKGVCFPSSEQKSIRNNNTPHRNNTRAIAILPTLRLLPPRKG